MEEQVLSMYQTVNSFPSKCFNCPIIREKLKDGEPLTIIRKYDIINDDCQLWFEPITIDTLSHDHYN